MNGEPERVWKEAVVIKLSYSAGTCLEEFGEPWKESGGMDIVLPDIRTRNLTNANL
jgi:hypothetical protein